MVTFGKMTSISTWPTALVDTRKKPPDKPGPSSYCQRLIQACTSLFLATSGGRRSLSQHGKPAIAAKLYSLIAALLIIISCA